MIAVLIVVLVLIVASAALAPRTAFHSEYVEPLLNKPEPEAPLEFYVYVFTPTGEQVSDVLPSYYDALVYGDDIMNDPLNGCKGFKVVLNDDLVYSKTL